MHNLLESRKKHQSPTKLQNLSPDKYGKAAYADLHFTPSKLAQNVLFREVTTLKKYEDGTNKLREFQALNQFFQDRIKQIQEERDGIQNSLLQQITMYKRMINDMETKHQTRLKDIQKKFNTEIHKIIEEKEEEAKYSQSEKQVLEQRINELEQQIMALRGKLDNTGGQLQDLKNQYSKLQTKYNNIEDKLAKTQSRMNEQYDRSKKEIEELSRKLYNTQVEAQKSLQAAINGKNKEIQNLQKFHKTELQKIQNSKSNQSLIRNQEIKDLRSTFEAEAKRLDQIINMKDRMVDSLTKQNNKQKNSILQLTRNYENEINNLSHQKSRLLLQVDQLSKENTSLNYVINDLQKSFERQKNHLEGYIQNLKGDFEFTIKERDRNSLIGGKNQYHELIHQNQILCREVSNLRQVLLESSLEMEKCKDQFLKMGYEKDQLVLKLQQLGFQNQMSHYSKINQGEQSRRWKDNYKFNHNYK